MREDTSIAREHGEKENSWAKCPVPQTARLHNSELKESRKTFRELKNFFAVDFVFYSSVQYHKQQHYLTVSSVQYHKQQHDLYVFSVVSQTATLSNSF